MERHIKAAQLADQIRDYLAAWTAREYPGSFVIITDVTLTPNLQNATVWIRIIGAEREVFEQLVKNRKRYQHRLVTELSRHKVPYIRFAPDVRTDYEGDMITSSPKE